MPSLPDLPSSAYLPGEKEKLPPPAALFGDYFPSSSAFQETPRSPNARPVYILPPPSSLPGYHLPPPPQLPPHASMPYFYPPATPSPPPPPTADYKRYQFATTDTADDQASMHSQDKNKRKRRDTRKKQVQSPPSPPYHYEVIELQNKKTKRQKVESEAISAAAATLASFAHAPTPACEDGEDDSCVGSGELACDQCDATYQHTVCLRRHRWEHADGWKDIQGRLSMSKKQQVQVLEAAQILMDIARCGMRVSVVN